MYNNNIPLPKACLATDVSVCTSITRNITDFKNSPLHATIDIQNKSTVEQESSIFFMCMLYA
jgi:hypothetical protein